MDTAYLENEIYEGTTILYSLVALTLGLGLAFNIFRIKDRVTPLMLMSGLAMLCDFVDICLHTTAYEYFYNSNVAFFLPHLFDVLVSMNLFFAGVTLVTEKYPSKNIVAISMVPFLLHIWSYFVSWDAFYYYGVAICLIFFAGFVYIGYRLLVYDKQLPTHFSDVENRSKSWFFLFAVLFNLEIVFYYYRMVVGIDSIRLEMAYNTFMILTYLYFAQKVVSQERGVSVEVIEETLKLEKEIQAKNEEQSKKSNKSTQAIKYLTDEQVVILEDFMENKKGFLDPDLTVDVLTTLLDTNAAYLYYYFRDKKNTKFYDYVNGYRIEEAKKLLLETDRKLVAVALESGFKSAHSFTRVFKQHEGILPSEWRKQQEDK